MRSTTLILASLMLLNTHATVAQQDRQEDYFGARHVIGAGAAYQGADTSVRASVPNLPEVKLDLDDLGMDDTYNSWSLEYRWRFASRWMLVAMAYTFDQDGRRTVDRDFNFDGVEFQAGASVDTGLSIDTYIVDLLYQVYRSDNTEIMLGGGLHAFDLDATIRGQAFVGDIERESDSGTSDLLAPLPNLRAQATHKLRDNWAISVTLGWLSASYGDYDGSFAYLHPRVAYRISGGWAASLGYQYVDVDLTQEKSNGRELALDATFTGPTLHLHYRF